MKADGRRLGRIVGQLDDLEVLLEAYNQEAYDLPVINEHLREACAMLYRARVAVGYATSMVNELSRGER